MDTIPTTLSAEDAAEITTLLLQARRQLADASAMRDDEPNYGGTRAAITDLLSRLGVEVS